MRYGISAGYFAVWQSDQDLIMVLHHMPIGQNKPRANECSRRDHIGSLDANHSLRPGADRGTSVARYLANPTNRQDRRYRKAGQQTKGEARALHKVSRHEKN